MLQGVQLNVRIESPSQKNPCLPTHFAEAASESLGINKAVKQEQGTSIVLMEMLVALASAKCLARFTKSTKFLMSDIDSEKQTQSQDRLPLDQEQKMERSFWGSL